MARSVLLAAALLSALSAGASGESRELLEAVRQGDATRVAAIVREGNVNASSARGWTALMEAASSGRLAIARLLLDAGADPDARDRRAGTALDVAEAAGHDDVARLLRERGSRGSGKSRGDRVCALLWQGGGFCGTVEAIAAPRYRLRVTSIVGCQAGCAPDAACSAGRPLGGSAADRVEPGDELWLSGSCLTHTGLAPAERP